MSKVVVSIVTNDEQDYIESCLKGIYDFADAIVIVHGEAFDARPTDVTFTGDIIRSFPDPEGKIRSAYLPLHFPPKKDLAFAMAQEAGFDWYMTVDADEFYRLDDLERMRRVLDTDHETDVFFMDYFAFCFNFWTGYWNTVDKDFPQSERVWRNQVGLHTRPGHCERFYDKDDKLLHRKVAKKFTVRDHGVMMYHMTMVKTPPKMRMRMHQRMGKDGWAYYDEILKQARPDNLEEIYQKNQATRGIYGLHWIFRNVVLSRYDGRPLPAVLENHPLRTKEWVI